MTHKIGQPNYQLLTRLRVALPNDPLLLRAGTFQWVHRAWARASPQGLMK